MALSTVDRESPFAVEELFFSTTDPRGVIVSGNGVFSRTSGYPLAALLGQPHNIIRHPDMPRIAFKVFWEKLQAGEPVAAYVKNRAADGAYYWVLATAVPVPGGYLSIRLKPTSPLFAQVPALYNRLRAAEYAVEGPNGSGRKQAMAISGPLLQAWLEESGFGDYEHFMRHALPTEVAARQAQLRDIGRVYAPNHALSQVFASCTEIQSWLDMLVGEMSGYEQLGEMLGGKSVFLLALSEQIRLAALNTLLVADRLGSTGRVLASVAGLLRDRSAQITALIHRLRGHVDAAVGLLAEMKFQISLAKLQTEMTTLFTEELIIAGSNDFTERSELLLLASCLDTGVRHLLDRLADLDGRLAGVRADTEELGRELHTIMMVNLNGRIESTRLGDNSAALALFADIGRQVAAASEEVESFGDVRGLVTAHDTAHDTATDAQVRTALATLAERMDNLRASASHHSASAA